MNAGAWLGVAVVVMGLGTGRASACGGYGGPAQLEALLAERRALLARGPAEAAALADLEAEIDLVAGQKDAAFSGLYWHRDRESARRAALAARKPIVTLRLLGDLSCDRSCANSRFFRTALYANAKVAALLRERAVLHWESVRPVPTVTIDMGDGRRLERTITGNSVHYVTTAEGEVVDVLPGLYGPGAFHDAVARALDSATTIAALPASARPAFLRRHHLKAGATLSARRDVAVGALTPAAPAQGGAFPTAEEAAPVAIGKSEVERPILRALRPAAPRLDDDATWEAVAARLRPDVLLDASSRELMRRKARAGTSDAQLGQLVRRFEERLAVDTVKNDLLLRPRALAWLAERPMGIDALNDRVYAELFLTPKDDPWLGLDAAGEYSGLEGDGIIISR